MRLSIVLMGLAMVPAFAGPLAGDVASTQGPVFVEAGRWTPVRRAVAIQRLAHQMENRSRRLARRADRGRGHYDRRGDVAARALYALAREAGHFHEEVERRRRSRRHTLADFRELERAFVRAARVVNRGHFRRGLRREFENVARTFDELAYYMGRRPEARFGARGAILFKDAPVRGPYDSRGYDQRRYEDDSYGYDDDYGYDDHGYEYDDHGYEDDRGRAKPRGHISTGRGHLDAQVTVKAGPVRVRVRS